MRKPFALVALVALTACASLPTDVKREASSHTDREGEPSRLARITAPNLRKHPGQSGFWLLGNGLDAFAARILLAEAAQRTIDAQYYLYHNDLTGKMLTHVLLRAADRGVRVRLLLDDMATKGIDAELAALDTHPNFEVRVVNPYANRGFRGIETLARFDAVTRRMHNKSFSVDNTITIVGGRNVGDEYFDAHEDVNFGDMDVLAAGPVATEVGGQFDRYWNNALAYPIASLARDSRDLDELRRDLEKYGQAQRGSPYAERVADSDLVRKIEDGGLDFKWGRALVFYDLPEKLVTDPDDRSTHMGPKLRPYTLGSLDHDLLIFSPYFVPGADGVKQLTDLEKEGIQVKVVTNSLASTDVAVVHAGYAKYREPLLRGGVELYEIKPQVREARTGKRAKLTGSSGASLHAKTFVLDREVLFIGSPNLDPRSGKLNTEIGILFESGPLAKSVADGFDANAEKVAYQLSLDRDCQEKYQCKERLRWSSQEDGREVVYLVDPQSGVLTRFFLSLVSLLPIEGQL